MLVFVQKPDVFVNGGLQLSPELPLSYISRTRTLERLVILQCQKRRTPGKGWLKLKEQDADVKLCKENQGVSCFAKESQLCVYA